MRTKKSEIIPTVNPEIIIKLTSLWAFSEAVLGGFFHAFRIPFSGSLLAGIAAILISQIAYYSEEKGEILKATLLVLFVKAAVSPNSPLTAYFAVSLQGFLGSLFFYSERFYKTSAIVFATLVVTLTAVQRIFTLTLLFGENLWHSINIYAHYVLEKIGMPAENVNVSLLYIGIFILLHSFIGFLAGKYAAGLPDRINNFEIPEDFNNRELDKYKYEFKRPRSGRVRKIMKKLLFILILIAIILSYIYPDAIKIKSLDLIIMFLRSVIIIFLWVAFVSPFLYKSFRKFLDKKQAPFINRVNAIIESFPYYKKIFFYARDRYKKEKIILRVRNIFFTFTLLSLFTNPEN